MSCHFFASDIQRFFILPRRKIKCTFLTHTTRDTSSSGLQEGPPDDSESYSTTDERVSLKHATDHDNNDTKGSRMNNYANRIRFAKNYEKYKRLDAETPFGKLRRSLPAVSRTLQFSGSPFSDEEYATRCWGWYRNDVVSLLGPQDKRDIWTCVRYLQENPICTTSCDYCHLERSMRSLYTHYWECKICGACFKHLLTRCSRCNSYVISKC